MTQFIQYLYEYKDGERIRNLGFMKVEQLMDKMMIQIYAKQLDEIKGIQFQKSDGSKYVATWEIPEEIEQEIEADCYFPPSTRRYEKIQRQDLARLPKREWRMANNSFLLHGYYNYDHLILGKLEDHMESPYYIGVPGVYYEREKRAARMFGFVGFECADQVIENGSFGYYMIEVKI